MYKLELSREAQRFYARADKSVAKKLARYFQSLETDPSPQSCPCTFLGDPFANPALRGVGVWEEIETMNKSLIAGGGSPGFCVEMRQTGASSLGKNVLGVNSPFSGVPKGRVFRAISHITRPFGTPLKGGLRSILIISQTLPPPPPATTWNLRSTPFFPKLSGPWLVVLRQHLSCSCRYKQELSVLSFEEKERTAFVDIDGVPSIAAGYRSSWARGTMLRIFE